MKGSFHIAFLVAATLTAPGCATRHSQEPVFQGKRLTEWLKDYALFCYETPEFDQDGTPNKWTPAITKEEREVGKRAQQALQQIGTNALPSLLRMVSSEKASEAGLAEAGLNALGQTARPAVPALIAMLETNFTASASALGAIGPAAEEATPVLLLRINPTNGPPALAALQALGQIGGQPELAVPVLTDQLVHCARDMSQAYLAVPCLMGLAGYGEQAKAAIPAIEQFLTAKDPSQRINATNTLKRVWNRENMGLIR